MKLPKILIVEDNKKFAEKCIELLYENKFNVITYVDNLEDAKSKILEKPDVVLIDLMLPPDLDREGLQLLRFIQDCEFNKNGQIEIIPIFMTTRETKLITIVSEAFRLGAKDFLDKNEEDFHGQLIQSIKKNWILKENNNKSIQSKIDSMLSKLDSLQSTVDSFVTQIIPQLKEALDSNNEILAEELRGKISDSLVEKIRKDIYKEINNESLEAIKIRLKNIFDPVSSLMQSSSLEDLSIAEFLFDEHEDKMNMAILELCKSLEREIVDKIFNPFKDHISALEINDEEVSEHIDKSLSKKKQKSLANKIKTKKILFDFCKSNTKLTLGNFVPIFSFMEKNEKQNIFDELNSFMKKRYNKSNEIADLIIKTGNREFPLSIAEMRNHCAHPKDIEKNNTGLDYHEIINKESYLKIRKYLISETALLKRILSYADN